MGWAPVDDDGEDWPGGDAYPGRNLEGPEAQMARQLAEQECAIEGLRRSLCPGDARRMLVPFAFTRAIHRPRWR